MAKKQAVQKKQKEEEEKDFQSFRSNESTYELSDEEVLMSDKADLEILSQFQYRRPFVDNDFNISLSKIKSLKELLSEETSAEKQNQQIVDSLVEKISEMIKKLE